MSKNYLFLIASILLISTGSRAQTMNELAGRWQDENHQFFLLESANSEIKWKNERSQNWTLLKHVSGFDYVDDDGYKYAFDPFKGTLKTINPDNERDIKSFKKMDFRKPGGKAPKSSYSIAGSDDYRGAHGFLLMYRASAGAPIGAAIGGIGRKMGLYGAFRLNQGRPGGTLVNYDSGNQRILSGSDLDLDYVYVYNGYTVETRGAITLGYIYPFKEYLSFFAGFGYGWNRFFDSYDVYDPATQQIVVPDDYPSNTELRTQEYGVNRDTELQGLELEFGAMAHYSQFTGTIGISTISGSAWDFVFGVGFLFH